ncbi:hypothetical protein TELCIR_05582 [Teladorsagia circumcincta]|uniref:Uncharacterized protein n=1 Tax=Teladorsagia circumcincta TaxID=45464 RepID=A0A2G9UQD2_TELCI|nr:hypothetical protein TELCIR_05582 [Teladorsagia circumcincta]
MVFFLSHGVRQYKTGHLAVYLAYLAIYVFMMMFIIFGMLVGLSFLPSYRRRYCDEPVIVRTTIMPSSTDSPLKTNQIANPPLQNVPLDSGENDNPNCAPLTGAFWASVWVSVALSLISVLIACIQIRYTLVLYKYLRTRQRQQRSTMNVSYQHFVPGAPPRYTPESPHTLQTSPALVEAGPLPPKLNQPEVATLTAESLMSPPTNPPPSPIDKTVLPMPRARLSTKRHHDFWDQSRSIGKSNVFLSRLDDIKNKVDFREKEQFIFLASTSRCIPKYIPICLHK